MSTLKKVIFASFVAFGIACLFQSYNVEADSRYSAKAWVEAPASSGALTGWSHGCAVQAVYASSNMYNTSTNWFLLIATNPLPNIASVDSFAGADYRSPAMSFPIISSNTTNSYSGIYKVMDYGEGGVSFSSAPYVYKSSGTSGQAQRVFLQIIP